MALAHGYIDFTPMNFPWDSHFGNAFSPIPASQKLSGFLLVVPHASLLPAWSLPLRAFDAALWGALLATASVYALAWRVVAGESLAASAAAALRAFSSCGGAPQDRVRATPQRLQLAGALVASAIVVATIYQGRLVTLTTVPEHEAETDTWAQQGRLVTLTTVPEHEAETDTWAQLVSSGLPLQTVGVPVESILEYPDPEAQAVLRHGTRLRVLQVEENQTLEALVQGRRFAWVVADLDWRDLCARTPRITQLMRPMRHADIHHYSRMHAKLNWPWLEALNEQLLLYQGAGLFTKWREYYERADKLIASLGGDPWTNVLGPKEPERLGTRVLDLRDVAPHFELLGAGLALAAFLFVLEICTTQRVVCELPRIQGWKLKLTHSFQRLISFGKHGSPKTGDECISEN